MSYLVEAGVTLDDEALFFSFLFPLTFHLSPESLVNLKHVDLNDLRLFSTYPEHETSLSGSEPRHDPAMS